MRSRNRCNLDDNAQIAIWRVIKSERSAVLVTVGTDGLLQSRPMGCVQREFDGTMWFMTFKSTPKLFELESRGEVLVSFARPSRGEFVSLSGRARVVNDTAKIRSLWFEGLRTWFPEGPESPNIALIAIDVEVAKVWTNPASLLKYAYFYVRARLTGRSPTPAQMVDYKEYNLRQRTAKT